MDLSKFWVIVVFVVCYEQSSIANNVNALNKHHLGRSRSKKSADTEIYLALPPDDQKTGKQHGPPTLIHLESNAPNKFKGKFPTPIERFIQRIQNYFSVYNPPEYLNDLRPGINNPENDTDPVEFSNNTQVILPCNGTSTIVIIPVPLESENISSDFNTHPVIPEPYKEPSTPKPYGLATATSKPICPEEVTSTKAPCPEVTTPKPDCLEVTTPKPKCSEVSTPKPECPELTSPKPECPELTTPKPKCPEVTTPKPMCPEVTTPKPKCQEVTTPKPKCPKVTTPKPMCPEVTTPKSKCSEVTTPKPRCPEATTPEPKCPENTTPKPKCPEVTTPKPECPEVTTPKPKCPEVTTPNPECLEATTQKPICPPKKPSNDYKPISGYGPSEVPPLNLVVQPALGSTVVYYYKNPSTLPPIPSYYIPSTPSPYEEHSRRPKPPILRLKQLLFPRLYAAFHPDD